MMTGIVQPTGDATILLHLRGPRGIMLQVQAVIDTGFNDCLTLNTSELERLEAVPAEHVRYTLADGTEAVARLFLVEVEWHGVWREMLAVEMVGDPLLGMAALRQSSLHVDVIDGGAVHIRPL
jgi:clan AA aspartic protease